jgi:hypothetical protein
MCLDLARYWYESGRVKHLVYRNNVLKNCDVAIRIGVDGISDERAPRIHQKIEIVGNHFSQIKDCAIRSGGVRELILSGNVFDTDNPHLFEIV